MDSDEGCTGLFSGHTISCAPVNMENFRPSSPSGPRFKGSDEDLAVLSPKASLSGTSKVTVSNFIFIS